MSIKHRIQKLLGMDVPCGPTKYRDEDFVVEYWPSSQKYYVRHNGKYLKTNKQTGLIELVGSMEGFLTADVFTDENLAWQRVDELIAQEYRHKRIDITKDGKSKLIF